MLSLFGTIDTDGSGAIDAEELSMALEMMGLNLSIQMVVELIDSVDDDGELEMGLRPHNTHSRPFILNFCWFLQILLQHSCKPRPRAESYNENSL